MSRGFELFCVQSFSGSFGLFSERVGHLAVVLNSNTHVDTFVSQMNPIVRGMYINAPCHGARIVEIILSDPRLRNKWRQELAEKVNRERVKANRE